MIDRRRLIHSHDWFPAAIVRPLPGRPLEFHTRVEAEDAHCGKFSDGTYVVDKTHESIAIKDVLAWRYLPSTRPYRE